MDDQCLQIAKDMGYAASLCSSLTDCAAPKIQKEVDANSPCGEWPVPALAKQKDSTAHAVCCLWPCKLPNTCAYTCTTWEVPDTSGTCPGYEKCCAPRTPPGGITPPGTGTGGTATGGTVSLGEVSPVGELTGAAGVAAILGKVINAFLGFIGAVALLMFVYGGFLMLISGGKPEEINKGKGVLVWAVIGLIVVFMSYTLANFVINSITSGVTSTGGGGGSTSSTGKDDSACTAWGGTCRTITCAESIHTKATAKQCINDYAASPPLECMQSKCLSKTDWDYVCCKAKSGS